MAELAVPLTTSIKINLNFVILGRILPAYIEAKRVKLVAASDLRPAQLEDFKPKVECNRSLYLFHGNGEAGTT